MAVAAAASGGATIAPRARAAAIGRPAMVTPSHATAPALKITATMARANRGLHSLRASPTGKSNAASTSTGARNRASAVWGSIEIFGAPGTRAKHTPAAASMVG